jgi:hypothetical protein
MYVPENLGRQIRPEAEENRYRSIFRKAATGVSALLPPSRHDGAMSWVCRKIINIVK